MCGSGQAGILFGQSKRSAAGEGKAHAAAHAEHRQERVSRAHLQSASLLARAAFPHSITRTLKAVDGMAGGVGGLVRLCKLEKGKAPAAAVLVGRQLQVERRKLAKDLKRRQRIKSACVRHTLRGRGARAAWQDAEKGRALGPLGPFVHSAGVP